MKDFSITFDYPWLLLIIVVGIIAALIPHFTIRKKFRRNRNRIISLILHITVLVLSTLLLSGMRFNYNISNDKNEILLLIDVSDSSDEAEDMRDEFVETVVEYGKYDNYSIGVVTFGFDQEYAVPFTTDSASIYSKYLASNKPDTSATNIAAALDYSKNLFTYPETGKIILLSDGVETDENALTVIRAISASGLKVDTCYLNTSIEDTDVQIISLDIPDVHISVNEEYDISFSVKANDRSKFKASILDNGIVKDTQDFECKKGENTFSFKHTFESDGFHEISISIEDEDEVTQNNEYRTYINIETFNKVLVIESIDGESDYLIDILTENDQFEVDKLNISVDDMPESVDELRQYDQVILCNVHINDMPTGFDSLLKTYVGEYGGGLFTIGGDDSSGKANAYNRNDMYGTDLQEILPVQLVNYTPPVGVIFIIDKSGSMSVEDGATGMKLLDLAIAGAQSSLSSLEYRDYIGVMTLDSVYGLILPLTPCTDKPTIAAGIEKVSDAPGGGTIFTSAIEYASKQLLALTKVDKRHIIIITDGQPGDQTNPETGNPYYEDVMEKIYSENGITTSVVLLGQGEYDSSTLNMQKAVDKCSGRVYPLEDVTRIATVLRDDLRAPEIVESTDEEYNPFVKDVLSPIFEGIEINHSGTMNTLDFKLGGFYGVRAKNNSKTVLMGNYDVPLYTYWNYGQGVVGSFMCDLKGKWSSELLASDDGKRLIRNIVRELMPTEDIKPTGITLKLKEENYINQLSIYPNLGNNETIRATIINTSIDNAQAVSLTDITDISNNKNRELDCYVTLNASKANNFSRTTFVVREPGIYQILVEKLDADNNVIAQATEYKVLSYSKEYDISNNGSDLLNELALRGNGVSIADIEDPIEVFDGFVVNIAKTFDPRIIFAIIAIILFLLDIAVRKFKFKWIHELVKERKK